MAAVEQYLTVRMINCQAQVVLEQAVASPWNMVIPEEKRKRWEDCLLVDNQPDI